MSQALSSLRRHQVPDLKANGLTEDVAVHKNEAPASYVKLNAVRLDVHYTRTGSLLLARIQPETFNPRAEKSFMTHETHNDSLTNQCTHEGAASASWKSSANIRWCRAPDRKRIKLAVVDARL